MKQKYPHRMYCKECKKWIPKRGPHRETINFILNYSKALKIQNLRGIKFEAILN